MQPSVANSEQASFCAACAVSPAPSDPTLSFVEKQTSVTSGGTSAALLLASLAPQLFVTLS
jgi:hypothetical protein